jgi:hypothetical protein
MPGHSEESKIRDMYAVGKMLEDVGAENGTNRYIE